MKDPISWNSYCQTGDNMKWSKDCIILRGRRKTLSYGRMTTNKYGRNDRVRKSIFSPINSAFRQESAMDGKTISDSQLGNKIFPYS